MLNYDDPQPGDVVIGRAGDLNHLAFIGSEISWNYYAMTVVQGFCYIREKLKFSRKIITGTKIVTRG